MPFVHDNKLHLFHLASPLEKISHPERVCNSLKHLVTTDLINWQELPDALLPGIDKNSPDRDGIWTGSIVFYKNVFHFFYTGYAIHNNFPQTICHATSLDCVNFEKDKKNPIIIPDTKYYETVDWRDPFVFWNDNEKLFWMIISARYNQGPQNLRAVLVLYKSKNLETWDHAGPFYSPWDTYCIECPELFLLDGFWYLAYSRFSEKAQTIYRYSKDLSGPWRIPKIEAFDGRRWYAAKSAEFLGKRYSFGWIHDRDGFTDDGNWLWGGDMALPREVYKLSDNELRTRVPECIIQNLKQCAKESSFIPVLGSWEVSGNNWIPRDEESSSYGFVDLTINEMYAELMICPSSSNGNFGLLLKSKKDLSNGLIVEFSPERQSISIIPIPQPLDTFWRDLTDRKTPVPDPDGPRAVEQRIDIGGNKIINCSILISGSLVEVFINNEISMSYRYYLSGDYQLGFYSQFAKTKFMEVKLFSNQI